MGTRVNVTDSQDGKLAEGGKQTTYKWWCAAPANQDCYSFYVVKYITNPTKVEDAECWYLDFQNNWVEFPVGGFITSCFQIPGKMVQVLSTVGFLDREDIASQMQLFCINLIQKVGEIAERDREIGVDNE